MLESSVNANPKPTKKNLQKTLFLTNYSQGVLQHDFCWTILGLDNSNISSALFSIKPKLLKVVVGLLLFFVCFLSTQQTHAQCDPAELTATSVNGTCFANASITADLSTQSNCLAPPGPYQYVLTTPTGTLSSPIDADGTAHTFGDLPAGSYSLKISNGTAAQDVQYSGNPITLTTTYVDMSISSSATRPICPANADTLVNTATLTIDIAAGTGTGDFTYQVTTTLGTQTVTTSARSHTFTGLPPNETASYTVTDAVGGLTGCQVIQSQTRDLPSSSFSYLNDFSSGPHAACDATCGYDYFDFTFRAPNADGRNYIDNNADALTISINGAPAQNFPQFNQFNSVYRRYRDFNTPMPGDVYVITTFDGCRLETHTFNIGNTPTLDIRNFLTVNSYDYINCGVIGDSTFIAAFQVRNGCPNINYLFEIEDPVGTWTAVTATGPFGYASGRIGFDLPGAGHYRVTIDNGTGCANQYYQNEFDLFSPTDNYSIEIGRAHV